ncbi:MAG: hypothetical protein KME58_16645, partial [Candidatus Thiodiazotropha sp. (ex Lucina pensylvanica)]|nr:hypothetical protein [Candidatus Thiodiazotropha sp. (ex Lucina pensylvanica)]
VATGAITKEKVRKIIDTTITLLCAVLMLHNVYIELLELLWSVSNLEDITMLGSEKAIVGAIAILVLGIVAAVLLG